MKTILEFLKVSSIKSNNIIKALKFESVGNSTLDGETADGEPHTNFEYSYDGTTWETWKINALEIKRDKPLYIRGNNLKGISFDDNIFTFTTKGDDVSCSGNIMHLIDYENDLDTIPCDYCFEYLFSDCRNLIDAPELPATLLKANCYYHMFSGCISLNSAPELPATTLAKYCYCSMFSNCISLSSAPELLAETLINGCYNYMFFNCKKMKYVKAMFTSITNNSCTSKWLVNAADKGKFVKNSTATWDVNGFNGIPEDWDVETVDK